MMDNTNTSFNHGIKRRSHCVYDKRSFSINPNVFVSEKKKRALSLEPVLFVFRNAERNGSDKDSPEGSRCVVLSDTVCMEMIEILEAYIESGFEYLLNDAAARRSRAFSFAMEKKESFRNDKNR